MPIDGDSVEGPSPMETLLLSLAACMSADVCSILAKSRVPLSGLEMDVEGVRAETDPRRYLHIKVVYRLDGPGEEHRSKVQRAVDLSRDKYCSVLHTLRPDVRFEAEIR